MFDELLGLIAPHACLECGSEGGLWCDECRFTAKPAVERCYRCRQLCASGRTCVSCRRQSALFTVRAATLYAHTPKALVWKLKFGRGYAAAAVMAALLADRCSLPAGAIVTHVPTSTSRVRQRGYDQAALIARQVARLTHLPYQPMLTRFGQQQQHTATRRERLVQLEGAFTVRPSTTLHGEHIVLIDDVITTGATLQAAARALKAAGARRVSAAVFAQA